MKTSIADKFRSVWAFLSDAGVRAVKTGIQTFAAQVAASGLALVDALTDVSLVEKAGIAALAAFVSYVWNVVLTWANGSE